MRIPPLPQGFQLEEQPAAQAVPPLPEGFRIEGQDGPGGAIAAADTSKSVMDYFTDPFAYMREGLGNAIVGATDAPRRALNVLTQDIPQAVASGGALGQGIMGMLGMENPVAAAVSDATRGLRVERPEAQTEWMENQRARFARELEQGVSAGSAAAGDQLASADGIAPMVGALIENPSLVQNEIGRMLGMMGPVMAAGPASLPAAGGVFGAMTGEQVEQQLMADPAATLAKFGAEVRATVPELADASDEDVLRYIAGSRSDTAFGRSALVNSILPRLIPGGTTIENAAVRAAPRLAATRGGNAVRAGVGETATEFMQGGTDKTIQNLGTGAPVLEGVGQAAVLEGLLAGPIGGAIGYAQGGSQQPAKPAPAPRAQQPGPAAPQPAAPNPQAPLDPDAQAAAENDELDALLKRELAYNSDETVSNSAVPQGVAERMAGQAPQAPRSLGDFLQAAQQGQPFQRPQVQADTRLDIDPTVRQGAVPPDAVAAPENLDTSRRWEPMRGPDGKVLNDARGRPKRRPIIDYGKGDGLREWLAAAGGVNFEELRAYAGADRALKTLPEVQYPFGMKNWPVLSREGMSLESMIERMQADGWLSEGESDMAEAADMVMRAINGEKVFHPFEGAGERFARQAEQDWQNAQAKAERDLGEIGETPQRVESIAERMDERADVRDESLSAYEQAQRWAASNPREAAPMFSRMDADAFFDWGNEADLETGVEADMRPARSSGGVAPPMKSPQWRAFTKNTKVRDESGNVIPLYHGTADDFTVFDDGKSGSATQHSTAPLGHFLTPDRTLAEGYARKAAGGRPADERVIEAWVAIDNPLTMTLADMQAIKSPQEARNVRAWAMSQGYDGIHVPEANNWIAFTSNQVKDVDNRGTFDRRNPDIRFSRKDGEQAPTFYSAATRAVTEAKGAPKRGDAGSWKQWLDGSVRRGDMKQSERDWLGIDAWLDQQQGPVTREALAEFVRQNEVQVSEVTLGDDPAATLAREGYYIDGRGEGARLMRSDTRDEARMAEASPEALDAFAALAEGVPSGGTKFSSYRTPGGENYRELLLTLPDSDMASMEQQIRGLGITKPLGQVSAYDIEQAGGSPELSSRFMQSINKRVNSEYRSSHWDQPNVLAHVRFDERTDADGKRVLFIQEIQSDWHQEGRKKGYKGSEPKLEFRPNGRIAPGGTRDGVDVYDGDQFVGRWASEREARADLADHPNFGKSQRVPNAPLKQTDEWAMLAFKRMARWAVDNGFDRIAWATGEQNADLFDLSKRIDYISARRRGDKVLVRTNDVSVDRQIQSSGNGEPYTSGGGGTLMTDAQIEAVFGKDYATRILEAAEQDGGGTLEGDGLKMGGEGMRGFYDRILPAAVGKWAKKFGARVGQATLPAESEFDKFDGIQNGSVVWTFDTRYAAQQWARAEPGRSFRPASTEGAVVHSIDITPAMREAVAGGQPLFRRQDDNAQAPNGIPQGLPAALDADTRELNRRINGYLANGQQFRARTVARDSMPDALAGALAALEQATGTRVTIFRNLTPDTFDFNGVSLKDGVLYVNEAAQNPATTIAGHEFVHDLRRQAPDLYAELEAEVRRQGRMPEYAAKLRSQGDPNAENNAAEELTADAVGDALTDRGFLERMAQEAPTLFKRVAEAFMRFLDTITGRVRDLGSNAYLQDVQAFRDVLADVLKRYEARNSSPEAAQIQPQFSRKTPQQAEQEKDQLRQQAARELPQQRGTPGWNYERSVWEGRKGQLMDLQAKLQDKMNSWRDVQNQIASQVGKAIPDAQNVYRIENLMHGRVKERLDALEESHIVPLVKAMQQAKVKSAELEEYLYARHAQERNAEIAKINPRMPDGGSGMTNAEAKAILAKADTAKLDPLAKMVDAMAKATRRRMLANGLVTQEQFDAMEAQYQHYVPLRGKKVRVDEATLPTGGAGRGVDGRRAPVREALGRGAGNRAENILAEVIGDAQRSIIMAEKARVGRSAMRLVLANPNPDLWEVEPVQTEFKKDANGEVYEAVINDWNDQTIVGVRVKGQLYKLKLNVPLARALNHVGVDQMGTMLRFMGALNRYFSAVLTKYNPAFTGVNATRDIIFGLTGMAVEHGEIAALKAAASYPKAALAAFRQARRKSGSGKWDTYAQEFADAGGKTGYVAMPSVEDLARMIGKGNLSSYSPTGMSRAVRGLADAVGVMNDTVENALRLSAYGTLRERGMSAEAAAEYAKNLTVNFNRKGISGTKLNALLLFYNAATQGVVRTVALLKRPKTWGYLGSLVAVQAIAAMYAMGLEDDDGEPLASKVPEHVWRRNIVLVTPDGGVVTIPMPYGFNWFTYMGGRTVRAMMNDDPSAPDSVASIVGDATSALIESFSPVPLDDGAFGIVPTAVRIPLAIQTNRDDLGREIRRDDPYARSAVPRASMGKPDTMEVFKLAATGLNRIGGGDDYKPPVAALDFAPEDLEYLVRQAGGGALSFVVDTAMLGQKAAGEFPLEARDWPIAKRFYQGINEQASQAALFYQRRETIDRALNMVRDTYKRDGRAAAQRLMDSLPELSGATFRRRKSDGKVVESNGSPQIVPKSDRSVFGLYRETEKAVRARNEAFRQVYSDAPANVFPTAETRERDRKLKAEDVARMEAQRAFNAAWTKDVTGAIE